MTYIIGVKALAKNSEELTQIKDRTSPLIVGVLTYKTTKKYWSQIKKIVDGKFPEAVAFYEWDEDAEQMTIDYREAMAELLKNYKE